MLPTSHQTDDTVVSRDVIELTPSSTPQQIGADQDLYHETVEQYISAVHDTSPLDTYWETVKSNEAEIEHDQKYPTMAHLGYLSTFQRGPIDIQSKESASHCVTGNFTRTTTLLEELSECGGFLDDTTNSGVPGHVPNHVTNSDLNTDNCTVELYHDMDKQQPCVTSPRAESHDHTAVMTTRDCIDLSRDQLSDQDSSRDMASADDVPISSIWESRWLDHAAHLGRVMAQDKLHYDTTSTLQDDLLKNVACDIVPLEIEKPRTSKRKKVEQNVEQKKVTVKEEVYNCKIPNCEASFTSQVKRWYHQQSAHKKVQLQCPDCGKVFITLQQLKVHLRSHYKIKPFKCEHEGCDKTFLTQQQCNNHTLIHTGEKNFECSECHKKFREKNTLKRHSRTHSKVKEYTCEVCHKPFSYASTLNKHRKDQHADVLDSPKAPWIRTSMLPTDSFHKGTSSE